MAFVFDFTAPENTGGSWLVRRQKARPKDHRAFRGMGDAHLRGMLESDRSDAERALIEAELRHRERHEVEAPRKRTPEEQRLLDAVAAHDGPMTPAQEERVLQQAGMRAPRRTPAERRLLKDVARLEGRPLTPQEENLAIEQARQIGDLP